MEPLATVAISLFEALFLANVLIIVYAQAIKKKDVERELGKAGWWLKSHAAKHDKWTNGVDVIMVPRHNEINENTARGIFKEAKGE